jgi:4-hydroxy-2-oxoheptanedioate aldolase
MIASTSPHWPQAVKSTGADFVFIDTEHIAIDRTTSHGCARPIGRSDWRRSCEFHRLIHMRRRLRSIMGRTRRAGALHRDRRAGQRLRGAVKLRPLKGRLLEEVLSGERKLEGELLDYIERRCAENLLLINIESVPAIEALDDLLAVPGVDAVQVRPHDLSCNLGAARRVVASTLRSGNPDDHPKARAHGVGAGIHYWWGIENEVALGEGRGKPDRPTRATSASFADTLRADLARFRDECGDAGQQLTASYE